MLESRPMTFARILQNEMLKRGWSQSDMARAIWNEDTVDSRGNRAAKGRDRISQYVNGRQIPEPQTLRMMADVLGMTVEELAPDVTADAIEKDNPSLLLHAIGGHDNMALLKVNRILPLSVAAEVIRIIEAASKKQ